MLNEWSPVEVKGYWGGGEEIPLNNLCRLYVSASAGIQPANTNKAHILVVTIPAAHNMSVIILFLQTLIRFQLMSMSFD